MKPMLAALALAALAIPAGAQQTCGQPGVVATVSPATAPPGTPMVVTLTNGTNLTINLPTSCVYEAVYDGTTCTGNLVFGPICLQVITPIAPGQSRSMAWNQNDDLGNQVPPGDYSIFIRYWDSGFTQLYSCCVPVTILGAQVGVPYCFGDGSGTPCPCGNFGATGRGCANGTFAIGCELSATGNPSVSNDTIVLHARESAPLQPGLFFQADNRINGGAGVAFGDGLRCAGGALIRLEVAFASNLGSADSTVTVSVRGGVAPGDLKRYQWWYRDPLLSPCATGFNLSNGLELVWGP